MANTLDLEEQEQLDQIKHFWNRYGNAITWVAIVIFGSIAAWNAWQYWQAKQSAAASVLYDEVERAVVDRDAQRMDRAFNDLKDKYGGTAFAQQGALLAAKGLYAAGASDKAKVGLEWAAGQTTDPALQAVARLRLSALALEQKDLDGAAKWLEGAMPPEFAALVADRKGDILISKDQKSEARQAYQQAFNLMDEQVEYRRLIEVKLNALGVDVSAASVSNK